MKYEFSYEDYFDLEILLNIIVNIHDELLLFYETSVELDVLPCENMLSLNSSKTPNIIKNSIFLITP